MFHILGEILQELCRGRTQLPGALQLDWPKIFYDIFRLLFVFSLQHTLHPGPIAPQTSKPLAVNTFQWFPADTTVRTHLC